MMNIIALVMLLTVNNGTMWLTPKHEPFENIEECREGINALLQLAVAQFTEHGILAGAGQCITDPREDGPVAEPPAVGNLVG